MSKIRFMSKKLLAITLLVAITLTSANYYPYADVIDVPENNHQLADEHESGTSDNLQIRMYNLEGQDITGDSVYYVDENGELSDEEGSPVTATIDSEGVVCSVDGENAVDDSDGEDNSEEAEAAADVTTTVDASTVVEEDAEGTASAEGNVDEEGAAEEYTAAIIADANGTPVSPHLYAVTSEGVVEAYYDYLTVNEDCTVTDAEGTVVYSVDITAEEAGDATPGATTEDKTAEEAGDATPGATTEDKTAEEAGDAAPGVTTEDAENPEVNTEDSQVEPTAIDEEEAVAPKATATVGWKTVGTNKMYYYTSSKYYTATIAKIGNIKYGFDKNGYLIKDRVFTLKGIKYVALANGEVLTGVGAIKDVYYITNSETGVMITEPGFYTSGGERYYVKDNGTLARYEKFTVGKKTYIADTACRLRGGVVSFKKVYYYTNPDTYVLSSKAGLVTWNNKKYYIYSNGKAAVSKMLKVNGRQYYASKYAFIRTGIFSVNGTYYYSGDNGALKSKEGFVTWDKKKYYIYANGKAAVRKMIKIGGKTYYASKYGYIRTGAFSVNGKYYYADKEGVLRTKSGLITWNKNKYYAREDGTLYKSTLKEVNGHTYYFGPNAYAESDVFITKSNGWRYADPKTFYVRTTGGFFTAGSQKYCSKSNGELYNYTKFMYGSKYYIAAKDCRILKGVYSFNGVYYYSDSSYVVKTSPGFITVGNNRYYCRAGGKIFKNGLFEVDGKSYIANTKAVILKGKFDWDDLTYYADAYGALISKAGFYTISGQKYFVDAEGVVAISTSFKFNNVYYKADANGKCTVVSVTGDKIIAIASKEVGAKSGKKYWDVQFGGSPAYRNGDATPWCGCFVAWCFKQAGAYGAIKNISNLAYVPSYSAYADSKKLWVSTPKAGDLIIYSGSCHIGIVEKCVGSTVYTIEGNAGPGVCKRKSMPKNASYIKGYIRVL